MASSDRRSNLLESVNKEFEKVFYQSDRESCRAVQGIDPDDLSVVKNYIVKLASLKCNPTAFGGDVVETAVMQLLYDIEEKEFIRLFGRQDDLVTAMRAKFLSALSCFYEDEGKYLQEIHILKKLIAIVERKRHLNDQWRRMIIEHHLSLDDCYVILKDPISSFQHVKSALNAILKLELKTEEDCKLYNTILSTRINCMMHSEAVDMCREMLKEHEATPPTAIDQEWGFLMHGGTHLFLLNILFQQKNYREALKHAKTGIEKLKPCQSLQGSSTRALLQRHAARVSFLLGEYEDAYKHIMGARDFLGALRPPLSSVFRDEAKIVERCVKEIKPKYDERQRLIARTEEKTRSLLTKLGTFPVKTSSAHSEHTEAGGGLKRTREWEPGRAEQPSSKEARI